MAARHLLALLLAVAATSAAATAGAHSYGGPRACSTLEAFLRSGPHFDFVAERLHRLPRRDVTLLLPLASLPSGSWLRKGLPPAVVRAFVSNLVLTRNYRSVRQSAPEQPLHGPPLGAALHSCRHA